MHIIKRQTLIDFCQKHADVEAHLLAWYAEIKKGRYSNVQDILRDFPSASMLDGERVKFKIKGGEYRLIVAFKFIGSGGTAFIKFIGTHGEYDKVNAKTVKKY